MQTVIFGRTGLRVSAAGLGAGGFSRMGMSQGIDHSASVARAAYDAGITFFDTAAIYGTQPAVGQGLSGLPRDSYALSTKFSYKADGRLITPQDMFNSLERSLRELRTDYVDVFSIHGLGVEDYDWAKETLFPAMDKARDQGKIRFPGVTERFGSDTGHDMLIRALEDDFFDVIMVGYNIINPSAAKKVLPAALERGVATQCMYAVRKALWNTEQLHKDIDRILESGQGGAGLRRRSLDFLVDEGYASTLMEAAYRFCRHTAGITVTLTGTGNLEHLKDNLASLEMPPLPDAALERLRQLFGNVDCVNGQ